MAPGVDIDRIHPGPKSSRSEPLLCVGFGECESSWPPLLGAPGSLKPREISKDGQGSHRHKKGEWGRQMAGAGEASCMSRYLGEDRPGACVLGQGRAVDRSHLI